LAPRTSREVCGAGPSLELTPSPGHQALELQRCKIPEFSKVFTLDRRDFGVYRLARGGRFSVIP
jgi:hypothetical protein